MENSDLTSGCHSEIATAAGHAENKMGERELGFREATPASWCPFHLQGPDFEARSSQELECWYTNYVYHSHVCVCVCVCVNCIKHMYKMNVQLDEL